MKAHTNKSAWNLRGLMTTTLVGILAITLAAGCKSDNTISEPQEVAALNVAQASPGALSVNFYVDGRLVNGPALAFTQQSGYLLALSGTRKFDVTLGGTNQVLVTKTLDLQTDHYYTAFIAGTNTAPEVVVTDDDLSDPPAGKAKIRLVQLIPDAAAVDLSVKGGATLFTDQAFKTATTFTTIDPGTYTLVINADETTAETTSLQLEAGGIYTVWAKGLRAGTGDYTIGAIVKRNDQ